MIRNCGFADTVLVEKPIFDDCQPSDAMDMPDTYVGYNLRFDPLIHRLQDWLRSRTVVAATIYVGRNLATLRPDRNFRSTSSAHRAQGGGVLRDLSHELDYVLWLFGAWQRVAAIGGVSGSFEVDADDRWCILLECAHCPQVIIGMSYLDRAAQRRIGVNAREGSVVIDLGGRTFLDGEAGLAEHFALERDETCRLQHEALLRREPGFTCTYREGFESLRLVEAVERASLERRWICSDRPAPQ